MSGYDRRRGTASRSPDAARPGVGAPGKRPRSGAALPRTTREIRPSPAPSSSSLQSPDPAINGREVEDVGGQLRADLDELIGDINRIDEGIILSKRDMRSWRKHNPIEVYVDEHHDEDLSDPSALAPLQIEWERLRGQILIDLTSPPTEYRHLAERVRIAHERFEDLARRTSNVTSAFGDRVGAWSRSLGDRAERSVIVKKVSFAAAALAAIPYAAGAAAAYGIEGAGSLALGRAGFGVLGGALAEGGLSAADVSDRDPLASRTLAGAEDGMLMGAAGPAGEAVGTAAKAGSELVVGESPFARMLSSAFGGGAEAAAGASTYAAGSTLAHGGDVTTAASAGILAAEEAAPFGALLGVAARSLEGVGAEPAAVPVDDATKDSVDAFCVGEVPKSGPARWTYLEDPNHWLPERRALHDELLAEAHAEAQRFADAQAARGGPPTIYAMRGNTATGKSRTEKNEIGEIQDAVKATGDMRSVNPDNFKVRLMRAGGHSFTSAQVHSESSMLASRLERELAGLETSDGQAASIMIDKRLATVGDVQHYAEMAKQTGRKLALYDVDAPLEVSLAGVLERVAGGPDPLPDFKIVGDGFESVRLHRRDVVELFTGDPALGSYELYGTSPNGAKILVASVRQGQLSIYEPDMYAELMTDATDVSAAIAHRTIDNRSIEQITAALPPERALAVRRVLHKYVGKTWKQALDGHSRERAVAGEE